MNVAPSSAVAMSQIRHAAVVAALDRRDSASTIVSELISRTNELTDVNGMS